MGHSRVALRKAFAFFGWSMSCAAISFALAGEQWASGISSLLHPEATVSGISADNLSYLRICIAGMLVSTILAGFHLLQGSLLLAIEKNVESRIHSKKDLLDPTEQTYLC